MRLVLGSQEAQDVWGMPSSCAQCMVTKGLWVCLGAMKDAQGRMMVLHMVGPIIPMSECHHPAMQCPGAG